MSSVPSRPLDVAAIHPFSWPHVRRGAERYLHDLVRYLCEAGHRATVITGADEARPPTTGEFGQAVVTVRHRLPASLARRRVSRVDAFGAVAFPALLRRHDVVHAFTPTAALAARAAGHRVVYTVLGHPTPDQYGLRPFDRRLMGLAIRRSHAAMALTQASADATIAVFPGADVGVLPPGIHLDAFPLRERPASGPPRVLFVSDAADDRKGLATLLTAAGRLLLRRPDLRVVVAGPGDPTAAFARVPEDVRGLVAAATDVVGVGELEDVPGRYRDATVTVLPARYEAFGLVLVESLASGTPVVGSDSGGMPEVVGPPAGGVGRIVPVGDVDRLATAIDGVIELAADGATPARCRARAATFSWSDVVGPRHVELYRRVARRP